MIRQLIIHIGVHKTGSTAVQHALWTQRSSLKQEGILYPDSGRPENSSIQWGHHEIPWFLNKRLQVINPLPSLLAEIESSDAHTIIISSEEFDRLTDEQVKIFFDNIKFEVKVIFYYRRQSDVLQGSYGTDVVHSGILSNINDYMKACDIEFNYFNLANRWAYYVGVENVIVRFYDRSRFPNGDIISSFIEATSLRDLLSNKSQARREYNISLPWYAVQCIQQLWRLNLKRATIYKTINWLKSSYLGQSIPYEFLSPSQALNFDKQFVDSNQKLADKFGAENEIISLPALVDDNSWAEARAGHYAAVERMLQDIMNYVHVHRDIE